MVTRAAALSASEGHHMSDWHCLLCGVRLHGVRQQSSHLRNYNLNPDDPSRCDNLLESRQASAANIIREPEVSSFAEETRVANVARISLLTRRCPSHCSADKYTSVPIRRTLHAGLNDAPLDFCHVQSEWDRCDAGFNI